MALHVLQVLNAFDHLFILALQCDAIGCPLRKSTLPLRGPLVVLVFTVCTSQKHQIQLDYGLMTIYALILTCVCKNVLEKIFKKSRLAVRVGRAAQFGQFLKIIVIYGRITICIYTVIFGI